MPENKSKTSFALTLAAATVLPITVALAAAHLHFVLALPTWLVSGDRLELSIPFILLISVGAALTVALFLSRSDENLQLRQVASFQRNRRQMSDDDFTQACGVSADDQHFVLTVRTLLGDMTTVAPEFIHPDELLFSLWQLLPPKTQDRPIAELHRRLVMTGITPPAHHALAGLRTVRDLALLPLKTHAFPVTPHSASAQTRAASQPSSNST